MNIREVLRQTASSIAAHKLRSFLTMFGIIWGITSVILLVGLGKGFSRDQKERLKTIGVDLAIIWGGRTSEQAGGYAAGRPVRLSIQDAYLIKNEAYLIKTVSPELRRSVAEVSRYNAASRPVRGVWPDYQRFRSLKVQEGRLMSDDDEKEGRRVVVLGVESRDQLFPGKPAIGETLTMNGSPYTVIGVLEKKKQNGSYGSGPDNTQLFVPYSSMARDYPPPGAPRHLQGMDQQPGGRSRRSRTSRRSHAPALRDSGPRAPLRSARQRRALHLGHARRFEAGRANLRHHDDLLRRGRSDDSVARRHRRHEHHAGRGHRAHSRDWRAQILGATARDIRNQFFAESATLMLISGALGLGIGVGICLVGEPTWSLPDIVPHPVISPAGDHRIAIDLGTDHGRRRNVSGAACRRAQSDRVSAPGVKEQGVMRS